MPPKFITKYGIFFPGEDEPREIHDFMSEAAMSIITGNAKNFNEAEIRAISVPEKEGPPCE